MHVKEMHIEVESRYQQVNAGRLRSLEPEEIDALLNDAVHWFIQQKLVEGPNGLFELKDTSEIATLLSYVTRPAYSVNDNFVTILPGDCRHLLSDSSTLEENCTGQSIRQTSFKEVYFSLLQFKPTTATTQFYKTVTLSINGEPVLNLGAELISRGVTYDGLSSKEELFKIREYIMEELLRKGYEVYYENWYDRNYPETLIVVSPNSTPYSLLLNMDGEFHTSIAKSTIFASSVFSEPVIHKNSDNRMIKPTLVSNTQSNPYYATHPEAPLSELIKGYIVTHANKSFIVRTTSLRYIKNPQKISLILDRDCDLPVGAHSRVVDMAVEIAAGLRTRRDAGQIMELNKLKSKN